MRFKVLFVLFLLIALMAAEGFVNVEYLGPTGMATSRHTVGAVFRARKPR